MERAKLRPQLAVGIINQVIKTRHLVLKDDQLVESIKVEAAIEEVAHRQVVLADVPVGDIFSTVSCRWIINRFVEFWHIVDRHISIVFPVHQVEHYVDKRFESIFQCLVIGVVFKLP